MPLYTASHLAGDGRITTQMLSPGGERMELFAVFGITNAQILMAAAAVFVAAAVLSATVRALRGTQASGAETRVDQLEIRMAAVAQSHAVLQVADEILQQVDASTVTPVAEIFEAAAAPSAGRWFDRRPAPQEIAAALVGELRDNLHQASAIARPIRNMLDNGAVEIAAERRALASDIRERAAELGAPTWTRNKATLLAAGVPCIQTEALIACFTHVEALSAAVAAMDRKPTPDQLVEVLQAATGLVMAAGQANGIFARDDSAAGTEPEATPDAEAA